MNHAERIANLVTDVGDKKRFLFETELSFFKGLGGRVLGGRIAIYFNE